MKFEIKIAEEVAIEEVQQFAKYHTMKEISEEEAKADFPDVILAVQRGLMTFDEDQVPTFTLIEPIKTESGGIALSSIKFKTRITVGEQERLAKGVDLKNDTFKLINKFRAYFIGQPVAMLDKIGKFDFKAIDQITSVFQ